MAPSSAKAKVVNNWSFIVLIDDLMLIVQVNWIYEVNSTLPKIIGTTKKPSPLWNIIVLFFLPNVKLTCGDVAQMND